MLLALLPKTARPNDIEMPTMNVQSEADSPNDRQPNKTSQIHEDIPLVHVDLEAPWRWLSAGWSDLLAFPQISLLYGALFSAAAIGMWLLSGSLGLRSFVPVLASGFMLIGPVLGVGLYEASRRREAGLPVRLRDVISAGYEARLELGMLGLALFIVFAGWFLIAMLLFLSFMGVNPFLPVEELVPLLLFTPEGVTLLTVGTIVGALLAALVFAMSVISAPMLLDRPIGVADAVFASLKSTALNIKPLALWAALIAGFITMGIATLSLGLVMIFPLIAHATWHAYRELTGGKS